MFSLRLNERRGGCMSRKTWYYLLIFFEVLLALSMLRSYGLHFEYETLNSVSLLSSQFPQQVVLVWFVFRLLKDKRKAEGVLVVLAFHICQLVAYFIVPASIFLTLVGFTSFNCYLPNLAYHYDEEDRASNSHSLL